MQAGWNNRKQQRDRQAEAGAAWRWKEVQAGQGRKAGTCFLTGSFLVEVTQAESQSVAGAAGQREKPIGDSPTGVTPLGSHLSALADVPRTCFSRPSMTCTACCRMTSLVCALSLCRWTWHILPSSLKASLMSRTRTLSLALLASRRSRSLCSFSSAVRFSSLSETRLQPGGWGGGGKEGVRVG